MYDVIIIGAGPAGMAAAVTAQSLGIKTLFVYKSVQKQATSQLSFFNLQNLFFVFENLVKSKQLEALKNNEIIALEKNIVSFSLETKSGQVIYAKTVIVASGLNSSTGFANTDFEKNSRKDSAGRILINNRHESVSVKGLFAVGEAASGFFGGEVLEVCEGVKAAYGVLDVLKKR